MNSHTTALAALFVLASGASGVSAQTEELYHIDKPAGILHGWGSALKPVQDLTGDGVPDMAIGVFGHGGQTVASVHSGADGALLYTLSAPFMPLFWGDGIVSVGDQSGDGVPELVVVGSRSGDSNSFEGRFQVHSGADGALLHHFSPPAGLDLPGHTQSSLMALADLDGDGSEDLLARTSSLAVRSLTLFSSATGQVLYSVVYPAQTTSIGQRVARVSDHDHDGLDDFAVTVRSGGVNYFEVRSAASGQLILARRARALRVMTGNLEPFLSVADGDGDGLRDLAVGGVFSGLVGRFSSKDGKHLGAWACGGALRECFGARVIEVDDFSGDGLPDLLALESLESVPGEVSLFGLDPASGAIVFEDTDLDLAAGYVGSDSLVAFPGVGAPGEPTFAMLEDGAGHVSVRRIVFRP